MLNKKDKGDLKKEVDVAHGLNECSYLAPVLLSKMTQSQPCKVSMSQQKGM